MANIGDKRLISKWGNILLDAGFHQFPNSILDYQQELDLSDSELLFVIKVTHFFKIKVIGDSKLNMDGSKRTIRRIRKSMVDKGYLRYDIYKIRNEKGKLKTVGIIYDWSGLIKRLEKILEEKSSNERKQPIGQIVRTVKNNREDKFDRSYNDRENYNREDKIGNSTINSKECIGKQQQEKDVVVVLIDKLKKRRITEVVANELVDKYGIERVANKLESFDKIIAEGNIRNPGGWLRSAIEKDYNLKDDEKENSSDDVIRLSYKQIKEMCSKNPLIEKKLLEGKKDA